MIVTIKPVQIWVSGEEKTATKFELSSVNDDFESFATLYYQLREGDPKDPKIIGQPISQGNLTINGEEYQNWNDDPSANQWILNWSLNQLGLNLSK